MTSDEFSFRMLLIQIRYNSSNTKTYLHTRKPFYNLINMVKRVLVGYGIDVDAVSGWYAVEPYLPHHTGAIILYRDNNRNHSRINTCSGAPAGPTDVS